MPKRDLTDAFLDGLDPPASGRLEIWDKKVPGLGWRMSPDGSASWCVRLRTRDGKRTRPTLGKWPPLSVKKARGLALAAIAEVAAGGDPVAAKAAERAARKDRLAEQSVADRLAQWQASEARRWSHRYSAEVARLADREIIPALGKKGLRATKREDWTGMVAKKRTSAPAAAANLYRVCSSFLNFAEAEGWIAAPLLARKGASRSAPPSPPRSRALSDDELVAIWKAAETEGPKARAFIRLLILTGCRRDEAAGIATGEVDRAAGLWRLPASRAKNNREHVMPLCALATAAIAEAWPEHGDDAGEDWRLLGTGGGAFSGFSRLKRRVDAKAGVADWRWHDLRRTCRTGLARLGVDRLHAERAIAHISGQSTLERTYDRHDYEAETLAALRRWQHHVASLVAPSPGAEILPMRRRGGR